MEKKSYIKPEIEVQEIVSDVIMNVGSLTFNDDKEVDTEEEQLSTGRRGRRGQWGNLWYTE
jgi:hypothetical protein